jgi:anti-anti-sigma factor
MAGTAPYTVDEPKTLAVLDRESEAGRLQVDLEPEGERILMRVWGELDLSATTEFETKLREAIRRNPFGVTVDLGGVSFIDSLGLRVLISAAMLAQTSRRELIVLRASEQARCVIETSGVEDLLPLAD